GAPQPPLPGRGHAARQRRLQPRARRRQPCPGRLRPEHQGAGAMRQRLVIAGFVVAVIVAAVVAMGAGGSTGGDYKVRAIFNNASFLIPGEDVKVAGAKVGKVDSLDVTPDLRAAAILDITDSGFQDFRSDAECAIRLQSVIGEKLVECLPTQPRAEGTAAPP